MLILQLVIPGLVAMIATLPLLTLAEAQTGPVMRWQSESPEEAARLGLEVLRQLGSDKDDEAYAQSLGFASTEEATHAELGSPFRIYRVPLDRLKAFHKGSDPDELLVDAQSVMYPLLVKGHVRSSLTVTAFEKGKAWLPTRTGSPKLISRLEQHRTSRSNFVVLISVLGLRFLGDRTTGQLMLIPITETSAFKLKAGQPPVPAREIFEKLALDAKVLD